MKKLIFAIVSIITLSFTSCKNEVKDKPVDETTVESDNMESDVKSPEKNCYKYSGTKDTVIMNLAEMNEEVAGTLSYNYYEKDKNDGTFEGIMIGDTIFADYTFNSEGKSSVREVVFLKKGDKLIEGYGDVEEVDGEFQFTDDAKFSFNEKMALQKIDCN